MNSTPIEALPHHEARILIVDDDIVAVRLIESILRIEGYKRISALTDPRNVLATFIEFAPDLVILDLMMPHLDGFQVLDIIQRASLNGATVPVLVVSAVGESDARYRALTSGAVDVFPKPFEARELLLRIANLLRLRTAYRELQDERLSLQSEVLRRTQELVDYQLELKQAHLEVIERLARAAEHRDDDTGQHTQRVGLICSMIADIMQVPGDVVEILLRASPLHDVGKIGVPDSILLKPGRLTPEELIIMQRHCEIGADLLSGGHSDVVRAAERIALCHHERWDGTGYPHQVQGEGICIEGRIVAVADVFDALTHERPYKKAWSIEQTLQEIQNQSGRHFDPAVVDAFMTLPHPELL